MSKPEALTQILHDIASGDVDACQRLWSAIYDELRGIAQQQMNDERSDHTLSPTALVNEAYLRLMPGQDAGQYENRRHFFRTAARAMRRIRIDHARTRKRAKRGHGIKPQVLFDDPFTLPGEPADVLALDEALEELEVEASRPAEVVSLRYFAGLQVDETAEILGVSKRTVINDWHFARAWLQRALT